VTRFFLIAFAFIDATLLYQKHQGANAMRRCVIEDTDRGGDVADIAEMRNVTVYRWVKHVCEPF